MFRSGDMRAIGGGRYEELRDGHARVQALAPERGMLPSEPPTVLALESGYLGTAGPFPPASVLDRADISPTDLRAAEEILSATTRGNFDFTEMPGAWQGFLPNPEILRARALQTLERLVSVLGPNGGQYLRQPEFV